MGVIFWVLKIPDVFGGWTEDAGPEPTYEEKMRVPPWGCNTLQFLQKNLKIKKHSSINK